MPPQPVKSAAARQERTSPKIFRSNLTPVEYRYKSMRLATTKTRLKAKGQRLKSASRPAALSFFYFLLAFSIQPLALPADARQMAFARAERAFLQTQAAFHKNPQVPQSACAFALACFDLADLETSNARRAETAEQGIAAARTAIAKEPKLAAAHYYLAMNLGELARTKKLGALRLLGEMESEFKAVIALDPKIDYDGPHRSLGMLYRDAPGWPTSIGNRSNARIHLRKAVELSPDYPDNWLGLLEAYIKWGDKGALQSQLPPAEEALQRARKTLTGEKWELSWQDWDREWQKIKEKAAEGSGSLQSPRQKNQ